MEIEVPVSARHQSLQRDVVLLGRVVLCTAQQPQEAMSLLHYVKPRAEDGRPGGQVLVSQSHDVV